MSMPTDAEQRQLNDEMDGPITHKFKKMLSQAEQRILEQVAPIQDKVDKHDGFIDKLRRGLGAAVKG
jgi:hypothetical protein